MSKSKKHHLTFARVSESGLVNVVDEKAIGKVPLYYCAGKWFAPNREGGFSQMGASHAGAYIAQYGHSIRKGDADEFGNTPGIKAMMWLMQNRAVKYAGPMAGWPTGAHLIGSDLVLVTEQLKLVEPKSGKWPLIQNHLETFLADEEHDQCTVFFNAGSQRLRHLHNRLQNGDTHFQHCPALLMFGDPQGGKSVLIDEILTPLFGGRAANPLPFLTEGKFNLDLFCAGLLIIDDKQSTSHLEIRRQRGDAIKGLIWNKWQRMEGKNTNGVGMMMPFWWMIIGGNLEEASLNISPALNDALKDKLIIMRTRTAENLPKDEDEKIEFAKKLRAELPAFAHFLLHYKLPKWVKRQPCSPACVCGKCLDNRTSVIRFWHPEISSALLEKQPECKVIEIIDLLADQIFISKNDDAPVKTWSGTATEFYNLISNVGGKKFEGLFTNIDKCGRMLSELARTMPERVFKKTPKGISHYEISKSANI